MQLYVIYNQFWLFLQLFTNFDHICDYSFHPFIWTTSNNIFIQEHPYMNH